VWDLLDRSHEPSLTISASSCSISSIAFSNSTPKHFTHGNMAAGDNASSSGAATTAADSAAAAAAAAAAAGGAAGEGTSGHHHHQHHQQQQQGGGLQVLAVGDAAGVLHLFELPRTLRRPLQNEKRLMEAFVTREAARVADVASRQVRAWLSVLAVGGVLGWVGGQQADIEDARPGDGSSILWAGDEGGQALYIFAASKILSRKVVIGAV